MPPLAASIFHYNEYGIPATKTYLADRGVPVRILSHPVPTACIASADWMRRQRSDPGDDLSMATADLDQSRRTKFPCRPSPRPPRAGSQQALSHGHETGGVRLAPQGRPAADDAPQAATSAALDMRPLTQEDMERLLLPTLDARTAARSSTTKAASTSPTSSATTNAASASACSSSAAGCRWSPAASTPPSPSFEELGLPDSHRKTVQVPRRPGHPGRRHRLAARARPSPPCSITSTPARAAAHPHRRGPDRVHLHRQDSRTSTSARSAWTSWTGTRPSRTRCGKTPT